MAPSRSAPPSGPGASRNTSSGRPVFFGSRAAKSSRIQKRTAPASEGTKWRKKEKNLVPVPTEADPEHNAPLAPARPEPESAMIQSSPKPKGRAHHTKVSQSSGMTTNSGALVCDEETEGQQSTARHNSSRGGQERKDMAELLLGLDRCQNFTVPSNKIIASEDVDKRIYEQMRRLAPGGELTADRVRRNLIDSIEDLELWWKWRTKRSRSFFWNRVCKRESTWMKGLDGAECREFFLWLVVYFRHGSAGDKNSLETADDALVKAFERLSRLFEKDEDCELDELVGIEVRVRLPAEQPARNGHLAGVSKKQDIVSKPVAGNIFRHSGNTNMTEDKLRDIDTEGLVPIVDVGDSRKKIQDWMSAFHQELKADQARIEEEEAERAVRAQAAQAAQAATTETAMAPGPQPTT
ncbi:hypothetical protein DHEL01_v211070 [Diaporthe helianthi]|uniref:Uncharacterized protein n=1 Tax=Diaporthe helianthi TaxID=158607 RepID=A0A2P5HJU0_DIAHE|nr:hypothetical protein DHEL01_v211070 [Diaporthe helianthi]